jgi:predicted nucleotidyltransferase
MREKSRSEVRGGKTVGTKTDASITWSEIENLKSRLRRGMGTMAGLTHAREVWSSELAPFGGVEWSGGKGMIREIYASGAMRGIGKKKKTVEIPDDTATSGNDVFD